MGLSWDPFVGAENVTTILEKMGGVASPHPADSHTSDRRPAHHRSTASTATAAVVLGPRGERATGGRGAALTRLAVAHDDPAFEQHLSDVRVCLEAMAAAVSLRFAVPCSAVVSALWRLGPAWAGRVDPAYLAQCLAGSGGGQQSATLSLVQEAACEISSGLQSAGSLVVVLLPIC